MIKIQRSSEPTALRKSKSARKYSLEPVKDALWRMQHGKCCYCERKIPQEGAGSHVEHFRPQNTSPELTNTWTNLMLSCPSCNVAKQHRFPVAKDGTPLLIDPSDPTEDPETHLKFAVDDNTPDFGLVEARRGSERGRTTIDTLNLHASEHVRARRGHAVKLFDAWITLLEAADSDQASATQAQLAFEQLLASNNAHAGFSREFARVKQKKHHMHLRIP